MSAFEIDRDHRWQDDAACRSMDTNLFVPNDSWGHEHVERSHNIARAACNRCPVKNQCLAFAMRQPASLEGIWGGTDRKQRRRLRRRDTYLDLPSGIPTDSMQELSRRFGVSAGRVQKWRQRDPSFPAPVLVRKRKLYVWDQVRAWAVDVGRWDAAADTPIHRAAGRPVKFRYVTVWEWARTQGIEVRPGRPPLWLVEKYEEAMS